jgi:hypothetical protein
MQGRPDTVRPMVHRIARYFGDEETAGSNMATLTGNRQVMDLAHYLRCWRRVSAAVTSTSPPSAAKAPENTARYACESLPGRSGALMAEGLNPIETGKKLHEHGEAAHHQAEGEGGHGGSDDRHSRVVQICEAVLLALVTITAAWAGYSAAKWSTASRVDIARASTLGNLASRDDLAALSLRDFDASTFNAWFTAFTLNSPQKEAIAVRRFRPQFLVAFNAWMATDPLHNPDAPPGPTYMPQYKQPEQAQANALDNESAAKFQEGNQAATTGDSYVRITVFLAAVLFLVGIGSSFKLPGVRYALIVFGSVLLIFSIVLILQLPGLPS